MHSKQELSRELRSAIICAITDADFLRPVELVHEIATALRMAGEVMHLRGLESKHLSRAADAVAREVQHAL